MQSSPGIPYCLEASTNGDWLKFQYPYADSQQAERLWLDVQRVLNGGFEHHFRVFTKDENHAPRKVQEGRWRLIIASALPVQVAWHMIFGSFYEKIVRDPYATPSAYGLVYPGGGWKVFYKYLRARGMNKCIDKSAWDFNAPGWVFWVWLRVQTELLNHSQRNTWLHYATILFKDAFENSLLHFPCGRLYRQKFSGFMKSGLVGTIDLNSAAQVLISDLASIRLNRSPKKIKATGDDTIEDGVCDEPYLLEMAKAGCVVKEVVQGYQFMGFDVENFVPMYPVKHLANIRMAKEIFRTEILDTYMALYSNVPEMYEKWASLAQDLGLKIPRRRFEHSFWLNDPRALDTGVKLVL